MLEFLKWDGRPACRISGQTDKNMFCHPRPNQKGWVFRMYDNIEIRILLVHTDELVQERRNSIVNAPELRLSCTKPSIRFAHPCFFSLQRKQLY